jgi:2-alkyl-3-oxoalkanoate reductase
VYDARVSALPQRVLVTGASGFVGRHVVVALQRRGVMVRAQGRNVAAIPRLDRVQPIRASLEDAATLLSAANACDAIVHCAALSAPWGKRAAFVAANVTGTANVIAAAVAAGVPRLVHVSSPAVCFTGDDLHNATEDAPIPTRHLSWYGQTKAVAEQLVRDASRTLECVTLRPKAIYGPGDAALVPRLIAAAERGRLRQIGDGRNLVDITFVDDVVNSILCALSTTRGLGEIFTITGGQHVALWPLINELLRGLGRPALAGRVSLPVAMHAARAMELLASVTGREPTLTRYSVAILARTQTYDISRARELLGFVPQVNVDTGLARTVDALRGVPARGAA